MRYANERVQDVVYGCDYTLDFDRQDWLDLAMAALDQAGITADEQARIAALLPSHAEDPGRDER